MVVAVVAVAGGGAFGGRGVVLRCSVLRAPVCGVEGMGVEGGTPDGATEAVGSCGLLLRVLSPCDACLAVAAAVAGGGDGGGRGVALRGIGGMGAERCELDGATEAFGSCVVPGGLWAAVGVADAGACCACLAAASCRARFVAKKLGGAPLWLLGEEAGGPGEGGPFPRPFC